MARIGLEVPRSGFAGSLEQAREVLELTGLPAVIRPSFTLAHRRRHRLQHRGLRGGGVARARPLAVHEILIEESVLGWKEYELEVMRDRADNFVVICSIENFDPMGSTPATPSRWPRPDPHRPRVPGDAQRLPRHHPRVGVETGGSNIQFAVDPETGRMVVIEMNPRVSRSSALASKATGFPIAKIAALLANRLPSGRDPQRHHSRHAAAFEPVIDYVVVKIRAGPSRSSATPTRTSAPR